MRQHRGIMSMIFFAATCVPISALASTYKRTTKSTSTVIPWFIILLFAIAALLIIIGIVRAARRREQGNITVTIQPVRTVYDEQQRLYRQEVISDTSNGRLIDGHPLRTREDWERWSKYDHEARDCADTFQKCRKELESKYCADPQKTLQQAQDAYSRYESLCTTYGMWNYLIQDHAHYIPTPEQKQRSQSLLNEVVALLPQAEKQKAYVESGIDIAQRLLEAQPGKIAFKADLARHLSSEMEITPSEAGKLLRILYNLDVLRESKNENGRIVVRMAKRKAI